MSEVQGADLKRDGVAWETLAESVPLLGHVDGEAVVVVRVGDDAFAVGAACTHYSGPLDQGLVVGGTLRCPLHHACFDLRTGEALRAPALNPLPTWTVQRRGGRIYCGEKHERDPLTPPDSVSTSGPPASPASIVILGAGAAGAAAAEMLRRRGYTGPVTLIDEDPSAPVDRPNLSKDYLAGQASIDWIPLRPHAFYAEHKITLRQGHATAIDPAKRMVWVGDESLAYDALILAMGAEPRRLSVPGAGAANVFLLRSLADSDAIIAKAEGAKRVVVIGASFIGLEVAAALRTRGLEVHVVAPEERPLTRVLGPAIDEMIESLHVKHGVRFHLSAQVARIERDAVVLADGTSIAADFVVAGVGVSPRTALAEAAGVRVDHGVIVDRYLATSVAGIWAAGDIARWPDPHTGQRLRVEHWVVAERQGQTVAENVLGYRRPFDAVPFFWSQHYDVRINYLGYSQPWERTDVAGSLRDHKGTVAFRARGATVAVASVEDDRRSLEAEVALERDDEAALSRLVPGS